VRTKTILISTALLVGLTSIVAARAAAGQAGRLSPHDSIANVIDGADVSITYGRPSMRGRAIMGQLVPYGRVWCPGADEATTLKTSKKLRIGNLTLDAGSYTLWMLPAAGEWSLIVNKETDIFHTQYSPRYDLGSIPMTKRSVSPPVEQLTFALDKAESGEGGTITMTWETTAVSVRFAVVQ
jgi:hypothetical protein